MRLLVSGASATLRRLAHPDRLGALLVPGAGNSVSAAQRLGLPWAADNAAFTGFDAAAFCSMLGRIAGRPSCLFVACPDVVGDAAATLRLFEVWQPLLRQLGLPVALVGQDGAERMELPWDQFDALFIGGSTQWKLGPGAAALARQTKKRGLWLHLGRANSQRRFRLAFELGCDSIDGSGFSRWPEQRLPLALSWLAELHGEAPVPAGSSVFFRGRRSGAGTLSRPGWSVERVEESAAGFVVVAWFVSDPGSCPHCGRRAPEQKLYRHGEMETSLRDVPRNGRSVLIRVRRRRFRCTGCGRTFLPALPGVRPGTSLTAELRQYLLRPPGGLSASAVARIAGVDEKTVRAIRAASKDA